MVQMVKVLAIVTCSACNGRAFLPTDQVIFIGGWKYFRHIACSSCKGVGRQYQWLSLSDLAQMLDEINQEKHSHKGLL